MKKGPARGLLVVASVLTLALVAAVAQTNSQGSAADLEAGRHWLTLMNHKGDTDDTISKREFNAYMDAEFDKADTDHDGTLSVAELGRLHAALMR